MEIKKIQVSKLKDNHGQVKGLPGNPRFIRDERYNYLLNSIKEDPEMLELREVIAYDNGGELVVICGNMRLRALAELGIKTTQVKILPNDTPVQKLKAYTIKDNIGYGQDDWDKLANEWDAEELETFGMELPIDWDDDQEDNDDENNEGKALSTKLYVECEEPNKLNELFIELQSRGFECSLK